MPRLTPRFLSGQARHEDSVWLQREVQHLYVAERRRNCSWTEFMELALLVPACQLCVLNDPWERAQGPDIAPERWREDLGCALGEEGSARILRELEADGGYFFKCRLCRERLRPWQGDDVYVLTWFPGERFGVDIYEPRPRGRIDPPNWLTARVTQLYGRCCFQCGSPRNLTTDHIQPVSAGGNGAFANLQPLCRRCNAAKADTEAEKVRVYSDVCFGPYPSGAAEGLFPTTNCLADVPEQI